MPHHARALLTKPKPFALPGWVTPGRLYNFGNALAFTVGLGASVTSANSSVGQAAFSYLSGSAAAALTTLSTLIFACSGLCYSQAWRHTGLDRVDLTKRADVLSGCGALLLGASLILFGELALGLSAALLHAAGKFGSAAFAQPGSQHRHQIFLATRWSVLASRALGLAACLRALHQSAPANAQIAVLLTLSVCYGLWAAADAMLLKAAR
jgi:hypothetical protein